MLALYRRHQAPCRYTSRRFRKCNCPIWVQGSLRGEYIRRSLDLRSWEAANDLVKGWEASGEVGVIKPEVPTVAEAVAKFFADAAARHLKASTVGKHKVLLEKRLLPFCERRGLHLLKQLDVDSLREFRASWVEGPLSAYKNLERLKTFFRFCHLSGWTRTNTALALKPPKVVQAPTLPFSRSEMKRIVAACDEYPIKGIYGEANRPRMTAFVLTLRYAGLRIRDVATLSRDRLEGSRLFLYTQKTGTPVYVPLPPDTVKALKELPNGSDYFFWTGNGNPKSAVADWQRALRRLFEIAKVDGAHAHRFRDTFAVALLEKGVSLETVSVLLGHSSVKITEKHYRPWVKSLQQNLEAAVRKAW